MERKEPISSILLTTALLVSGCLPAPVPAESFTELKVSFETDKLNTKAADPHEELISDVSLMVFDAGMQMDSQCRRGNVT